MKLMALKASVVRSFGWVVSALSAVLVVFLTTNCSGPASDASDRPSGSAAIVISALTAGDVASATVSITATDISVPVTATLSLSNGWQTTIDGIPAGTGRTFTLSAADSSGVERYHGVTSNVTITAGQTQSVVIVAQQDLAAAGFADAVPVIDLAQASSKTVAPGAVVNLNVTAHDPDPGDTLAFTWTASTGTFASATAALTTWTAPTTLGTYPITVAVSDPKQEITTATLQITVATPPPPVPLPRGMVWLLAGLLAAMGSLWSRQSARTC